jgi:hypothetical protein
MVLKLAKNSFGAQLGREHRHRCFDPRTSINYSSSLRRELGDSLKLLIYALGAQKPYGILCNIA